MYLPIYIAAGYPDRDTARAVADELHDRLPVEPTFAWWDAEQGSPEHQRMAARKELVALQQAHALVILDRLCGTGSAFETGFFLSHRTSYGAPPIIRLRLRGDEGKLSWFLDVLPVHNAWTESWEAKSMVDALEVPLMVRYNAWKNRFVVT